MLPPMKHVSAVVLVDNIIVVMGGWQGNKEGLNSVESFNFCNYSWEELSPMNKKRRGLSAVVRCTFKVRHFLCIKLGRKEILHLIL